MELTTFEEIAQLKSWQPVQAKVFYRDCPTATACRLVNEGGKSLFIYNKGSRRHGWRRHDLDGIVKIVVPEPDPVEQWRHSWERVVSMLAQSGLWQEHRAATILGLDMGFTTMKRADAITWEDPKETEPQRLHELDSRLDALTLPDIWRLSKTAIVKRMHFSTNKEADARQLAEIADAMIAKCDTRVTGRTAYDIGFEYSAGKCAAWYREEYKNMGNGHYYIALNATHALFVEDD